jgi:hypothetical protein
MVRFLSPEPNLDHLKNEAKALQKAHRRRDPEVCTVLRHVRRFRDASDEEILSADVPLTEVQFALALEYGFGSWPELRSVVVDLKPAADYVANAEDNAMVLPDPPGGINDPDRYAAAFSIALSYLEAPADYETVLGDTGLAFIFQADALHRPYGADVKNLDIGWWPLDEWGVVMRLDFLGRVFGVPVRKLPSVMEEYKDDPARHYREHYEAEVVACLKAGRPVVATVGMDVAVVFGLDKGDPPLLVQTSCAAESKLTRATHYPGSTFVLDAPGATIDRRQADVGSIDYAIRLGRDEVDLSHLPGKSSGRRSWELWASQLADEELCGPHFYHANVVRHLRLHRKAAASYLRTMSERHPSSASGALQKSAQVYESVVNQLKRADTSKDQLATTDGRERLISLIHEIMPLEASAQAQMAEAVAAVGIT